VTGLVKDLVTPLIGAIGGKPDFAGLTAQCDLEVVEDGAERRR